MAEPLKIYLNEAAVVLPLAARPAGSYASEVDLRGNTFVSTIYVKTIDPGASVAATWKDFNPLSTILDLYPVFTQPLATTTGFHRAVVNHVTHGVSVLELTVAGGAVEFGVFVTAVQFMTSYPADGGVQEISGTVNALPYTGAPLALAAAPGALSTPGGTATLISAPVPAATAWRLRRLEASVRAYGAVEVYIDATLVGHVKSGPASENPSFVFDPHLEAVAGETVEVRYTQSHGPQVDVAAFLFLTEVPV